MPRRLRSPPRCGKRKTGGCDARFLVWDALRLDELGEHFDTVLDSGLFHVFDDESSGALRRGPGRSAGTGWALLSLLLQRPPAWRLGASPCLPGRHPSSPSRTGGRWSRSTPRNSSRTSTRHSPRLGLRRSRVAESQSQQTTDRAEDRPLRTGSHDGEAASDRSAVSGTRPNTLPEPVSVLERPTPAGNGCGNPGGDIEEDEWPEAVCLHARDNDCRDDPRLRGRVGFSRALVGGVVVMSFVGSRLPERFPCASCFPAVDGMDAGQRQRQRLYDRVPSVPHGPGGQRRHLRRCDGSGRRLRGTGDRIHTSQRHLDVGRHRLDTGRRRG